jgi:hypothetical protein
VTVGRIELEPEHLSPGREDAHPSTADSERLIFVESTRDRRSLACRWLGWAMGLSE